MFYQLLKIRHFLEALYQTLVSFLRIVLRFRFKNNLRSHQHPGKRLVVLGNGPSLNQSLEQGLSFLEGADLMAVNQFALSDRFVVLQPAWYVLLDIGFFTDATLPRVKEITNQLIDAFSEKTSWSMKLLVPAEAKNSRFHREISQRNSLVEFVFFNRTNVGGFQAFRQWAYRLNLGMPTPRNVLIGCLVLGICMTYSEIFLVGADHTWLENIRISEANELISIEKHSYDKDKQGKPTPKAHPETRQTMKLHDYLDDLAKTFSAYHEIRRFAEKRGTRVVNATPGSYIDAFERLR